MSNLISGKEALIAIANGQDVIYICKSMQHLELKFWSEPSQTKNFTIHDFMSGQWVFKLKPQTITVTLGLPKPFESAIGDYYYHLNSWVERGYSGARKMSNLKENMEQFGAYRTEEEIKQVVAAWRGING